MADAVLAALDARLRADRSAALLIDYGYTAATRPSGPTVQALRGHAPADPLEAPGHADLTWLIDFDRARAGFTGGAGVLDQRDFLGRAGIGARAAGLASAHPGRAGEIADALERLTGASEMGTLFKVLAATSPALGPPLLFEDAAR